jgi:hypothetical protein
MPPSRTGVRLGTATLLGAQPLPISRRATTGGVHPTRTPDSNLLEK